MVNQNPEQRARDAIDSLLQQAGWVVQDKKKINFSASLGVAVREYQTDEGPADYVLFVNKQAVGVIEAKPESWGERLTTVEDQSQDYSAKQLDRDIVNPDQIRTVIRTFKESLPTIFPGRLRKDDTYEVPKTLIFAKTDSHADDIIQTVREEFGESNQFCKKVTYRVARIQAEKIALSAKAKKTPAKRARKAKEVSN